MLGENRTSTQTKIIEINGMVAMALKRNETKEKKYKEYGINQMNSMIQKIGSMSQ